MTRVWKRVVARRDSLPVRDAVTTPQTSGVDGKDQKGEREVLRARFAVYETPLQPPRVVLLEESDAATFMQQILLQAQELAQSMESLLPSVVVKELLDNLIHSGFSDPLVTLENEGNTLIVSDHGKGIEFPEKALQPGYSTATEETRRYIRGVGSGLPMVNDIMVKMGGQLQIERNLCGGAVVKAGLNSAAASLVQKELSPSVDQRVFPFASPHEEDRQAVNPLGLTDREKHVLLLLAEWDSAGPTRVAKELDISLSTAHRDLSRLERRSLLRSLPNGKKKLTEEGLGQLELIFSSAESLRPGERSQSSAS